MTATIEAGMDGVQTLGDFAAKLRVTAAVCPEGSTVTLCLSPDVARRLARYMDRAHGINESGVVAVGVVQIDRPGVVADLWWSAATWSMLGGTVLADFLMALARWVL